MESRFSDAAEDGISFQVLSINTCVCVCVDVTGVCVAGAPSSESRDFQLGRAEAGNQPDGESSGGQCTLDLNLFGFLLVKEPG